MATGIARALGFTGPGNSAEADLLLAASTSDIPAISRLLQDQATLNQIDFDCVDLLGRTPLQLAVENEDIEVTRILLPHCPKKTVEECLLFAISLSNENLAMAILSHPRYRTIDAENRTTTESASFDALPSNSRFPTNKTPLVLAAEENLYEVVNYLLLEGYTIAIPHPLGCQCDACVRKSRADYFRFAHERLNAYRGLASESYLCLNSDDPILDAFMLRKKLLSLSEREEYFKKEYCDLANALSAFSVKLLNKVIGDRELDVILDKIGGHDEDTYAPLGRLKLAVSLEVKQFVAHPSCQMRLKKMWYAGFPILGRGSRIRRIFIVVLYLLSYPYLAIFYILFPRMKCIQFMRAPWAKFLGHALFYVLLLSQLLSMTLVSVPYALVTRDPSWWTPDDERYFRASPDGTYRIRSGQALAVHYVILAWTIGLLWQETKEIYRDGWKEYFSSLLNWLDVVMLTIYIASFVCRFYAVYKVNVSRQYFLETPTFTARLALGNDLVVQEHYAWLNPDRHSWYVYDPVILAEGLFSIATVLDFARFASLLPAVEALGPLQISFGIMLKEILRFMGLFGLVFLAFMVGLANLYWFYVPAQRTQVELSVHEATVAEEAFGSLGVTFLYCFWSLFGMGERNAADISTFKPIHFTEVIGYLLYGMFMVCCVIVLLNLLIAMMSLSFSDVQDAADVEWKFSRTQLFFDYMTPGATLPPPLNLIPTPKSFMYLVQYIESCCRKTSNRIMDIECTAFSRVATLSAERTMTDEDEGVTNANHANRKSAANMGVNGEIGKNKYKENISRIVRRFISEATTINDDDKDDDTLKQDLLRIRRELTNALEMRAREIEQCRKDVEAAKKTFVSDLNICRTAITEVASSIQKVDGSLALNLQRTQELCEAEKRRAMPIIAAPLVTEAPADTPEDG